MANLNELRTQYKDVKKAYETAKGEAIQVALNAIAERSMTTAEIVNITGLTTEEVVANFSPRRHTRAMSTEIWRAGGGRISTTKDFVTRTFVQVDERGCIMPNSVLTQRHEITLYRFIRNI